MANKPQHPPTSGDASRLGASQAQRETRRRNRGTGEIADWSTVDSKLLLDAVIAVTGCKCAIQFGYTSDGGSYVVRIVGDGEPYNEYVRPTEDISLYFRSLIMDFSKS